MIDKPILGEDIYLDPLFAYGLVGCWLFNENPDKLGRIYDISGNASHGILVADCQGVPGKFGSVLDFDGTGDYVDLGSPAALEIITNQITISVWSRSLLATTQNLISQGEDAAFSRPWVLKRQATDKLRFGTDTSGGAVSITSAALGNTDDGKWHHACGTYDSVNMRLYWDGALVAGPSAQTGTIDADNGQKYLIGADDASGGISSYLTGQIDHINIWDRGFTGAEIRQLYSEPFWGFKKREAGIYI